MTLVIFSDDLDEIKILYYKLKVGGNGGDGTPGNLLEQGIRIPGR
jgi:hypothetical protein